MSCYIVFMFWVYVLENQIDKSWYIGATSDLMKRLQEHKSGSGAKTTRIKKGWKLIYCEGYIDKRDAFGREKFLKSGSGRRFLNKQMTHYLTD